MPSKSIVEGPKCIGRRGEQYMSGPWWWRRAMTSLDVVHGLDSLEEGRACKPSFATSSDACIFSIIDSMASCDSQSAVEVAAGRCIYLGAWHLT
jgi:hypothetical protein